MNDQNSDNEFERMDNEDLEELSKPTDLDFEIFGLTIEIDLHRKWLWTIESDYNKKYKQVSDKLDLLKKQLKAKQQQLDVETSAHPSEVLGDNLPF